VPTETFSAIVSSVEPRSAARRICARLSRRADAFPPRTIVSSASRSSASNVTRYLTFIAAPPSEPFDHGNPIVSIPSQPPTFTEKQGQYLAFIKMYAQLNGRPPAEADMERYFGVTPPSVHRMVVELEKRGLIRRVPRQPRSIELTISDGIPALDPRPIKSSGSRY